MCNFSKSNNMELESQHRISFHLTHAKDYHRFDVNVFFDLGPNELNDAMCYILE